MSTTTVEPTPVAPAAPEVKKPRRSRGKAAVTPDFDPASTAGTLSVGTVLFILELHQPSFAVKLPSATVLQTVQQSVAPLLSLSEGKEAGAEGNGLKVKASTLHIKQDLIDRVHMEEFERNTRRVKDSLRRLSVPSLLLAGQPRQYLIPVKNLDRAINVVEEYLKRRNELLDEIELKWDSIVEQAQEDNGEFFDMADYSTDFSEIRDDFAATYRYYAHSLDADTERTISTTLSEVGKAEVQKHKAMVLKQCEEESQNIRDALRVEFQGLVDGMVEMLSPKADGSKRGFQTARVEKLREFVTTLGDKNLTGDEKVASLATQAARLLDGMDPSLVKKDDTQRNHFRDRFAEVKVEAAKMVVVKARRFKLGAGKEE
jgi:hypothetical protein